MNPFLFIVGCPRSGTTLLQRIVDAHTQIAVTPETHWIPSYFHKLAKKTASGAVTRGFIAKLLRYHRFPQLGVHREALEGLRTSREPVSYARFVTGIFDVYGQARGKLLVGDKTPGYARSIPLLHGLWPTAKFVHLIRDGRDVCLSAIDWKKPGKLLLRSYTWSEQPVATAAFWWEWHVRLARDAGRRLGRDLYYEMRYEDLVRQPSPEIERLCAFLAVPFEEQMLRFHEGRTRSDTGLDAKDAWLPITAGLRNWRAQMPNDDVEMFEAAAGELLRALGYSCVSRRPQERLVEHVARIRGLFEGDLRARNSFLSPSHGGDRGVSS